MLQLAAGSLIVSALSLSPTLLWNRRLHRRTWKVQWMLPFEVIGDIRTEFVVYYVLVWIFRSYDIDLVAVDVAQPSRSTVIRMVNRRLWRRDSKKLYCSRVRLEETEKRMMNVECRSGCLKRQASQNMQAFQYFIIRSSLFDIRVDLAAPILDAS